MSHQLKQKKLFVTYDRTIIKNYFSEIFQLRIFRDFFLICIIHTKFYSTVSSQLRAKFVCLRLIFYFSNYYIQTPRPSSFFGLMR